VSRVLRTTGTPLAGATCVIAGDADIASLAACATAAAAHASAELAELHSALLARSASLAAAASAARLEEARLTALARLDPTSIAGDLAAAAHDAALRAVAAQRATRDAILETTHTAALVAAAASGRERDGGRAEKPESRARRRTPSRDGPSTWWPSTPDRFLTTGDEAAVLITCFYMFLYVF
jgi:hypothetical protein